jgi:hypothetical protein
VGKPDLCMQKTEMRSLSFTLNNYQLKADTYYIKELNIIPETLKVHCNSKNTLELIGIGNDFLN